MKQKQAMGDKDLADNIAQGKNFSELMVELLNNIGYRESARAVEHKYWPERGSVAAQEEALAQNEDPESKDGALDAEQERALFKKLNKAKLIAFAAERNFTVPVEGTREQIIDAIMSYRPTGN